MSYWNRGNSWDNHVPMLSTFAQVEAHYNNTTPVVSARHTVEDDIRPIGKRSQKHRRIMKVSRNCYAILSGSEPAPAIWRLERRSATDLQNSAVRHGYTLTSTDCNQRVTMQETALAVPASEYAKVACMLWRKHRDGSETLTIRNTPYGHATGHYEFLKAALPAGVHFDNRGTHELSVGGKRLFLPHVKRVTQWWEESYGKHTKNTKWTPRQDGRHVTLRRETHGWEVLHDCENLREINRKLIDLKKKAPHRKNIKEFLDWAQVMTPLLISSYAERRAASARIREYIEGEIGDKVPAWGDYMSKHPKLLLSIISDVDSPLRVDLLHALLGTEGHRYVGPDHEFETPPHVRQRNRFNARLNEWLGFVKKDNK